MDGYQEFLLSVRRDINCLCDNDRAVRRGAVVKLEKALLSGGKTQVAPAYLQRLFLEELHKPLFRMFADQGEKCREVSLSMTLRFSDLLPVQEVENVLPLLLAALLGRFRSQPFPEQSEELRLEALRVLSHLFDVCKEKLNPFASDILDALSKALTDSCPDAKKECCEITKKVSQYFDAERVSRAANPLVGSLLANLKHQQWKVRRATLESIGALLLQEATMMDHMEDVLPHLNALLNDRTPGVRQSLAETLERWLIKGLSFRVLPASNNFDDDGPEGFEKFESRLLILLLGVAADEEAEQAGCLEKVSDLKEEIHRVSKISPKLQKLLVGGTILNNLDRLVDVLEGVKELQLIRTDKWAEEVQRDWRRLRKASEAVRNDPDLVAACIDVSRGEAIKFAGEDVRSEKEIMLAAMQFDVSLCRYARGSLHLDREFLMAILRTKGLLGRYSGWFRWQSSPELCSDYEFLLAMMEEDGASFRVVSENLRSNETLARVAVEACPSAFRFASETLRRDRRFASMATRLDPLNLEFVDENLRADRAFVLAALEQRPIHQVRSGVGNSILKHLSQELREDLEIVSKALHWISPYLIERELQHTSSKVRTHPELQKLVPRNYLSRNGTRGPYTGGCEPVRVRPTTMKAAKEETEEETQQLPSFWLELVKLDPFALRCLNEDARQDKQVVMTAVKGSGFVLQYASAALKEDVEVVKAALKQNIWAYDYVPETLRGDKEIALLAFRLYGKRLPKKLLNHKEIVVGAIALGGLERVAALKHEVLLKRAAKEREREEARRKAKEAREGKAEGYMEQEILEFFFPASRRKVKIQSVKIQRLLLLLTMPVFCLFCLELRADLGLVYRTPGTPVGHIPTLTGKARALCGWKITSTVDHDLCEDAFEQHFTSGSWKPDAMDHGNQRICCQVVAGDAGGGQQTHRTLSGCGVSSPLQGSRR
eukprot:symbB.v1.2.029896.t2/scaffold3318.1/size84623/5